MLRLLKRKNFKNIKQNSKSKHQRVSGRTLKVNSKIFDQLNCRSSDFYKSILHSKKLVIVGDAGCGKTSLLDTFIKGEPLKSSRYDPTIYDSDAFVYVNTSISRTSMKIGCFGFGAFKQVANVELNLCDTSGQEDLDRLRSICYTDVDVVLVCFSIDDPNSFSNVTEKWVPEVRHFCGKVPIILVATKTDLRGSFRILKTLSKLSQFTIGNEEINRLAESIKAFACFETSSKTGSNIMHVFDAATRAAMGERKKPKINLFSL